MLRPPRGPPKGGHYVRTRRIRLLLAQRVQQAEDGCLIEAELPSDWRAFAGQLIVSIHREPQGTRVEAAAKTPGQIYDWGKNQHALQRLFSDLQPRAAVA